MIDIEDREAEAERERRLIGGIGSAIESLSSLHTAMRAVGSVSAERKLCDAANTFMAGIWHLGYDYDGGQVVRKEESVEPVAKGGSTVELLERAKGRLLEMTHPRDDPPHLVKEIEEHLQALDNS